MRVMRTTVTLEPDVAARIKDLAHERGISLKEAINVTLRAGLESGLGRDRPYREKTRNLGVQPGVGLNKGLQLAATLDDEETSRRLELRR